MPANSQLTLAHVLFIDIVGYSRLLNDEQHECLQTLNETIRASEEFRRADAAGKLKRLPTGDGVALVFFTSPEEPAECAVEISTALREHPEVRVRMGIHTGPVNEITDLNEQSNVAGGGINMAQRVMDCADAGHILMSRRVADDLGQYRHWQPCLHDLGTVEVKHGVTVELVNFCGDTFGNPAVPQKLAARHGTALAGRGVWVGPRAIAAVLVLLLAVGVLWFFAQQRGSGGGRAATQSAPGEKSIAVLPFENLSHDPDNAYFATGVQDEILTRLARVSDLKVISRTSTQQYQSQSRPGNLTEIARQLGVANILEGSVQKAGDRVRVTVQLIHAATDTHLWAESFDRTLSEIFEVQSEIAQRVAQELEAKLTGREHERITSAAPTNNPKAYEAYLRGLALDTGQGDEETRQARDAFREAVRLDPQFAVAWAALANRESFEYFGPNRTPEQLERARYAMEMALKLQPDSSEAHTAAGSFHYYCRLDFDRALEHLAEAHARAPNHADVILLTGLVKRRQGKLEECIELLLQAGVLDPRNNDVWINLARSHRGARRFAEAHAFFDRALAIAPGDTAIVAEKADSYSSAGELDAAEQLLKTVEFTATTRTPRTIHSYVHLLMLRRQFEAALQFLHDRMQEPRAPEDQRELQLLIGMTQMAAGDAPGARAKLEDLRQSAEQARSAGNQSLWLRNTLIELYGALGDREALDREAAAIQQQPTNDLWNLPFNHEVLGRAYALVGDADRALEHLEQALTSVYNHSITVTHLRLDPSLDRVRDHPRFQQLLHRDAP
ncbi:hypothetical protein BH20VER1_BH20VER1_20360 [soil metagenome]